MADVFDLRHAARGIPIFFERQNRQQEIDIAPHAARSIGTPGPQLRTDVIDNSKAAPVQPMRQTQVKVRPVNQDHRVRSSRHGRAFQFDKGAPKLWQSAPDFPQPENCQIVTVHDGVNTGGAHLCAGRSEKLELNFGRRRAQSAYEGGRVRIAGRFASNNHQAEAGRYRVHSQTAFRVPTLVGLFASKNPTEVGTLNTCSPGEYSQLDWRANRLLVRGWRRMLASARLFHKNSCTWFRTSS